MQLLTVDEAAERLSITPRQVVALMKQGKLPWVNVSAKKSTSKPRRRVAEYDVNAFIEARRVAPPPATTRRRRRRA